jgi:hypothetical protein
MSVDLVVDAVEAVLDGIAGSPGELSVLRATLTDVYESLARLNNEVRPGKAMVNSTISRLNLHLVQLNTRFSPAIARFPAMTVIAAIQSVVSMPYEIPDPNGKCFLLDAPEEIKQLVSLHLISPTKLNYNINLCPNLRHNYHCNQTTKVYRS